MGSKMAEYSTYSSVSATSPHGRGTAYRIPEKKQLNNRSAKQISISAHQTMFFAMANIAELKKSLPIASCHP